MYILNFNRELGSGDIFTEVFLVDDHVTSPETALKNAVKEYLEVMDEQEFIELYDREFTWADAIMSIPSDIWLKHGLHYNNFQTAELSVNEEENLVKSLT